MTISSISSRIINGISFRVKAFFRKDYDRFLKKAKGVVHVGANMGQEISLYTKYKLNVVWIEPIPEVFEILKANLVGVPRQLAIRGLVTDKENEEYEFNLATNYGASSSIFAPGRLLKDIWPDIKFDKTIKLRSNTLPSLLKNNNINLSDYDTLIMDTQGSELLVLKGAIPLLHLFTYIKTEVADFELYKGCCQLKDIDSFLVQHGYEKFSTHKFAKHPNGGACYDVVYKKNKKGS